MHLKYGTPVGLSRRRIIISDRDNSYIMDREHVETIVRKYYEHVDDERFEELFDLFADDIKYHRPGRPPIDGKPEFERFYQEERPIEEGSHVINSLIIDTQDVAVRGEFTGVQNGTAVSLSFADIHRFNQEGKISERWSYTDRDSV